MIAVMAAITGSSLLNALIWAIIAGVLFWLCNWLLGYIGLEDPFLKIAKIIIAVICIVILINALLTIAGRPFIAR